VASQPSSQAYDSPSAPRRTIHPEGLIAFGSIFRNAMVCPIRCNLNTGRRWLNEVVFRPEDMRFQESCRPQNRALEKKRRDTSVLID